MVRKPIDSQTKRTEKSELAGVREEDGEQKRWLEHEIKTVRLPMNKRIGKR